MPGGNEIINLTLDLTVQTEQTRFAKGMFVLSRLTPKNCNFSQQMTDYKRLRGFLDVRIGCRERL